MYFYVYVHCEVLIIKKKGRERERERERVRKHECTDDDTRLLIIKIRFKKFRDEFTLPCNKVRPFIYICMKNLTINTCKSDH